MYAGDKLYRDIQNSTTTTIINSHTTVIPESFNDGSDMTRTLSYAIPLSCLAIVIVVIIAVGIHRTRHVLEKWTSVKRMKNTDPRCYERAGLRRDSEYESNDDNLTNVTVINEDAQVQQEPDFRLATIT